MTSIYRMCAHFYLKEVEKAALGEKGITVQSVKEILQSLVADGYVDTDKIGTSVYYWAFPRYITIHKRSYE